MFRWVALCLLVILFQLAFRLIEAQSAENVPRIGFVSRVGGPGPNPLADAFRQGLRDLGYTEGKDILIEYRYSDGKPDTHPKLVAELGRLKVDVMVLQPQPAIRAAKQATKMIPIVMVTTQDPVAAGFIETLARPGGNITGVTTLQRELSGKRLEFLKEIRPGISRVAALGSTTQMAGADFKQYDAPARALKLELQPLAVEGLNPDFDGAFQAAAKERPNALITIAGSLLGRYTKRIADLAIKNRLPSMHEASSYVEAGGLMS